MDAAAPTSLPAAPPVPAWYTQAFAWIGAHVGLAEVVLVVLLLAGAWIVWKAQKRSDFDFADMLRDDQTGKPTAFRLTIIGSFAVSSWIVMHDTLDRTLSDGQMWAYLVTWSGAAVFRYAAEKWDGRLPWVRGDAISGVQNRPG